MKLIKEYNPVSKTEQIFKDKMLKLYELKGDEAFTRQNLEAHFTASAWVLHPISKEVLLLHHKKLNKWLQPGGHADGQKDLEAVARKEVQEEASLNDLQLIKNEVFDIDIHLIPGNKGIPQHEHFDVRFAYFCTDKKRTKINYESNDYSWVKFEKIASLTTEPSILRMAEKSKIFF